MMLGLLLARAGVDVVVLEKHADFLRDFRGDTVHPSTLQVMHELGLLDAFLTRPYDKAIDLKVTVGTDDAYIADFSRLRTRCGFIAMVPQWEFLDFLRDQAAGYPGFHLAMESEAVGLIVEDGLVCGVRVRTPEGDRTVACDLVVAADGRRSVLRDAAGLAVRDLGVPIDVLWMRLSKRESDPQGSGGRIGTGRFMAMIDRGSYWQCAYVIHKGGSATLQAKGLAAFCRDVVALAPFLAGRVEAELASWDAVKLLSVAVDRLEQWWKPGLLFIGDAAHAMSPIGGVGINLAIQDAVAAANCLAEPLADASVPAEALTPMLGKVQARRMFPTRVTQAVQVAAQNNLINPLLDSTQAPQLPAAFRVLNRFPALRAIPAYAVGIGVRPEHVRSPDASLRRVPA